MSPLQLRGMVEKKKEPSIKKSSKTTINATKTRKPERKQEGASAPRVAAVMRTTESNVVSSVIRRVSDSAEKEVKSKG